MNYWQYRAKLIDLLCNAGLSRDFLSKKCLATLEKLVKDKNLMPKTEYESFCLEFYGYAVCILKTPKNVIRTYLKTKK